MFESSLEWGPVITGAYVFVNAIFGLSYIPQIRSLMKDKSGALAISLVTWGFWGVSSSINVLYSVMILKNTPAIFSAAVMYVGTLTILTMASVKRIRYLRASRQAASTSKGYEGYASSAKVA